MKYALAFLIIVFIANHGCDSAVVEDRESGNQGQESGSGYGSGEAGSGSNGSGSDPKV